MPFVRWEIELSCLFGLINLAVSKVMERESGVSSTLQGRGGN